MTGRTTEIADGRKRSGELRGDVLACHVMTAARARAVVLAALAAGAGLVALVLASDHQEARTVWAIFGPVVGWSFVGTGLYAWRRRPESRIGVLMILLGFAWFLSTSRPRTRRWSIRSRWSPAGSGAASSCTWA